MAVVIPPEVIKEIAEQLEMGMKCWYHIPTGEVLWAPDSMKNSSFEYEMWEETFDEIDEKMHESIAFEGLDTQEEFKLMESFTEDEVSDPAVQKRLVYALNQRKPFMHFKSAIHYDIDYLDAWYAYKLQCYIDHVKRELERYNRREEEEDDE